MEVLVLNGYAAGFTQDICKLFSHSVARGLFPKIPEIQPIQKNGNKNYKLIVLMFIISKLMVKDINIELMKYIENSSIINDSKDSDFDSTYYLTSPKFGLVPSRSTENSEL